MQVQALQKQLKRVVDYLGLSFISTHSFSKMFATKVSKDSGYNLQIVQKLLNHASIKAIEIYRHHGRTG
ncbi:MAG: tyrosine-type recombinase/integrase [Zhenhengia sp.]|uniref:tyrosine-type recombinase/integrase n=1 Tax=Zhenhengia sp. TaxID=2944208 RepID=UPI00399621EE